MKKVCFVLIFNLLISTLLQAETQIPISFYTAFIGTWDRENMIAETGDEWIFSWGEGEAIRNLTLIIDFGLFSEPADSLIFYYSGSTFQIESAVKMEDGIYLVSASIPIFPNQEKSALIFHSTNNDQIWFESLSEFEKRTGNKIPYEIGKSEVFENSVYIGEENIFFKRSGPHWGIANNDRIRLRKGPSLDDEQIGYIDNNQVVFILDETEEEVTIGDMSSTWYKIKLLDGTEGWSYGHFIDVEEVLNQEYK